MTPLSAVDLPIALGWWAGEATGERQKGDIPPIEPEIHCNLFISILTLKTCNSPFCKCANISENVECDKCNT